jgi:hypothetical protein
MSYSVHLEAPTTCEGNAFALRPHKGKRLWGAIATVNLNVLG